MDNQARNFNVVILSTGSKTAIRLEQIARSCVMSPAITHFATNLKRGNSDHQGRGQRHRRRRNPTVEMIPPAWDILEDHGQLRPQAGTNGVRRQ